MTEQEKMLAGDLYDASDPVLVAARLRARRLTRQFSALDPGDLDAREALLRGLLGRVGERAWVEAPFHCDYGAQIELGDRVFVNMDCIFLDAAPITLADDTFLGPGVQLLTSDHPRDAALRAGGLESAHPISIGARAWLGGGVIVLPGVEIGHDAIIGAGSVVTRSVEPGVRAAGNPCRVIPIGGEAQRAGETTEIARWLEGYRTAWATDAPEDIAALFTPDARYFTRPYRAPHTGVDDIVTWWIGEEGSALPWTFEYEVVARDDNVFVVKGTSTYPEGQGTPGRPEVYHNLWLITLSEDGRASEFVEYWMLEE